jgi:hypothetical protein
VGRSDTNWIALFTDMIVLRFENLRSEIRVFGV